MALEFKMKDKVTLKQHVISGEVESIGIVDGKIQYLVRYQGIDGEEHSRFFDEGELTLSDSDSKAAEHSE
jgi:hypothetical protein